MEKILLLASIYGRGGIETSILSLAKQLEKNNLKMKIFNLIPESDVSNHDMTLFEKLSKNFNIPTKFRTGNKAHTVLQVVNEIVFNNPDYVIVINPRYLEVAYLVRKVLRKKYKIISWLHGPISYYSYRNNNALKNLKKADKYMVVSSSIKEQLITEGFNSENINVVLNPIDRNDQIIPKSKDNITRFVYIARLTNNDKNIIGLIDAISTLETEKVVHLDIFGSGKDEKMLKKYAKTSLNNVPNIVINWNGWSDNPWGYIEYADALLLNSFYEGLGMVLLEAVSRGVAILSSSAHGEADVIVDGVNGLAHDGVADFKTFKQNMLKIINKEIYFDVNEMKSSIEPFYTENYTNNIINVLRSNK